MREPGLEEWLGGLTELPSTGATRGMLTVLKQQPERSSFASAGEIADMAGVNTGSVTRGAQALGFAGWPALREELRARYLASLSMSEIADSHLRGAGNGAAEQAFETDVRGISLTAARLSLEKFQKAVEEFASATTRIVVGAGSYASVAQLLAINASLAGYPTVAPGEGAAVVNQMSRVTRTDFVFAISFWRLYESTITAVAAARDRGATICVLTDHQPSPLADLADFVLVASAEGNSYFPSMTPAISLANAFCASLAQVDAGRTRQAVSQAEAEWERAGLLRHPSKP